MDLRCNQDLRDSMDHLAMFRQADVLLCRRKRDPEPGCPGRTAQVVLEAISGVSAQIREGSVICNSAKSLLLACCFWPLFKEPQYVNAPIARMQRRISACLITTLRP